MNAVLMIPETDARTTADLTIEDLAAENQLLKEAVASLRSDVEIYREMVKLLTEHSRVLREQLVARYERV